MNVLMSSSSSSIPLDAPSASQITEVTYRTLLAREGARRAKVGDALAVAGLGALGCAVMSAGVSSILLVSCSIAIVGGAVSLFKQTKSKTTLVGAYLCLASLLGVPITMFLALKNIGTMVDPSSVHLTRTVHGFALGMGALQVVGICLVTRSIAALGTQATHFLGRFSSTWIAILTLVVSVMAFRAGTSLEAAAPFAAAGRVCALAQFLCLAVVSYRVHRRYSR